MDLFDLYAKVALDTGEYEEGLDRAGAKGSSFAEKLKHGLATAAKAAAVALGAATTAVGFLAKASIDGYAAQEQLVGGVKTLFGTEANSAAEYAESVGKSVEDVQDEFDALTRAQDTVFAHASEAYKTAGMTANAYMETVTGFSAALIQSLGGDTEKAAAVADTAITDMADNANKMGTAMESIQNAYQGFAKQNFTMLDNLKLGYGGTKEEMERLLDDAEKLPGALGRKFDISNYADIVEAIHLVQDEMGITGTTAAEASKTISGSIASAKAAWENLVTGLADENADLDTLIGNVVESVTTAGNNILPRVEQVLVGVGNLVSGLAPIIARQLPGVIANVGPPLIAAGTQMLVSLVQGFLSAAPQLAEALIGTIPTLVKSLQENAPQLMDAGAVLLTYLRDGVMQGIPLLAELAFDLLTNLGTYLQENLPALLASALPLLVEFTASLRENAGVLVDGALALLESLAQGLADSLPTLLENVPLIVSNIANIINDNAPKMLESAFHILVTLGQGLIAAIPALIANIPQILQAVADVITAFNWIDLGGNIIKSLGSGLKAMTGGLKDFMSQTFKGAIEYIKGLPAQALQWGKDFIGGLIKGITESIGGVLNAVKNIGSTIASYLHFSRPDVGPLRDYETWMPDMMAGLAAGIERGRSLVTDALDSLTEGMEKTVSSVNPGFGPDGLVTARNDAGSPGFDRPITININIDGAQYQDVNELAQAVADVLYRLFNRKVFAYA